jgi:hypothetical protein
LRFTIDPGAGLPNRKVLSKPIEELEVERPVEAGTNRSFCHVHPVIRLTGQSAVEKRYVKGQTALDLKRASDIGPTVAYAESACRR